MRPDISAKRDNTDLLSCSLFLLDMDGTLYLGDHVYEGAVDFIHTLEETGRDYIYLTNNSSRAGTDYVTRLRKLGFPCEDKNVFTLDEVLNVVGGLDDVNSLNMTKLELIKTAAEKGMSNDVILKIAKAEPKRKIKNGAMLIDIANREGGTIILGNGKTPDDEE